MLNAARINVSCTGNQHLDVHLKLGKLLCIATSELAGQQDGQKTTDLSIWLHVSIIMREDSQGHRGVGLPRRQVSVTFEINE